MIAMLLAALLTSAAPAKDPPIVFAPIEGEIMKHPCDPRPCLVPQPRRAHAYEGGFGARFQQQVNCIRAPCPPASTTITLPDGGSVRVDRIGYARGTPAALRLRFDRAHPMIRFEGKLWITVDGKLAIVAPTSAALLPPFREE